MSTDIRAAMTDPALFGQQFGDASWSAWRALLAGWFGLALSRAERNTFKALCGDRQPPRTPCEELWLVIGRRGGKSNAAALLAVFFAAFQDYRAKLAPGEVATVMVIAADRKQARSVMRYIGGLLHSNPMLERMILREEKESIELVNRTVIEVTTANFRAVRGYSIACCICDEIAFWRSDETSANPDVEIINALRPAMATLGGKLIALSSPYARRGELWNNHRRYFGQPGPVLVAQAPSRTMNPSLPQKVVAAALERDEAAAKAEYLAEFRTDVEAFITREAIDAVVRPSPLVLPYSRAHIYEAFFDASGGGADEATLAIGHREGDLIIVDNLQARKGTPATVIEEYAALLRSYCISSATSDRYAGEFPVTEFQRHGIRLEQAAKPKSDLYRDALAVINSGRCELPPDDKTIKQFCQLERRTARSGKDSIDHPPGQHDDRSNAAAGLIASFQSHGPTAGCW